MGKVSDDIIKKGNSMGGYSSLNEPRFIWFAGR